MKKLNTNKWVLLLVFFLLLTNIILAFLLFSSGNRNGSSEPYLVRHMKGLSESQKEMLRRKKEDFMQQNKTHWDSINILKEGLYKHLGDKNLDDSLIKSLTTRWNNINAVSDYNLFQHFREMRSDFSAQQQIAYDTLVIKMILRRR